MKLSMYKYQNEKDDERIRTFLREQFLFHNRREVCWPLYRWDYWRWFINEHISRFNLGAAVFIWQTEDGQIASVLHPDGAGEAFLDISDDLCSSDPEIDMISVAETQFAVTQPDGRQRLTIWTHESDCKRQDLLTRRGYKRQGNPEFQRQRDMIEPITDAGLPDGFVIRALGGDDELPLRSWVSWKAFHADEPESNYQGWEWYRSVQKAPLYRRDLDLVVVTPDDNFAAFCTVWYDDQTKTAAFEPVGTHPDYQRMGLAKALMTEGLRRVRDLGATLCTIGSYSETAGRLYSSLGFAKYELSEPWVKEW